MMMTSGSCVTKYKSTFDAASQIMAKGASSFFKGAGANILRGVAGGTVLPLYNKLQCLLFDKV